MRIINSVWFLILNAILGLVANVLAVGGFVLGVIELKPGWGPLSKPGPVVVLLYVSMLLAWLAVGFLLLRKVKTTYAGRPIPICDDWAKLFSLLLYVVTIPTTVLWILAWGELLGWPGSGDPNAGFLLLFGGGITLAFGGFAAAHVVILIDFLFNPGHYDPPEQ